MVIDLHQHYSQARLQTTVTKSSWQVADLKGHLDHLVATFDGTAARFQGVAAQ
ncbi:MAG TPA: hypothetical protein VFZ03_05995 [Dongiaceae bacterium]